MFDDLSPIFPLFARCRLADLRRWLAQEGTTTPLPEALCPDEPEEAALLWLQLLNKIPHHRPKTGVPPAAVVRAVLTHPWCVAHRRELAEADMRVDGTHADYYTYGYSTCTVLASIEGCGRLVKPLLELAGPAYFSRFQTLEDLVAEKVLRFSTVADAKAIQSEAAWAELLSPGPRGKNHFSKTMLRAAFCNPRRGVFVWATELAAWREPDPYAVVIGDDRHSQRETHWRVCRLIQRGIVNPCAPSITRVLLREDLMKVRDILAPPGKGLGIYLKLLTEDLSIARLRLLPGDWWKRCDYMDEWASGEKTVPETYSACVALGCRASIARRLDKMLAQPRFRRAPADEQRRAVAYLMCSLPATSPCCGDRQADWFWKTHREWPGLDYRLIYERRILNAFSLGQNRRLGFETLLKLMKAGGPDVVRVLCCYVLPHAPFHIEALLRAFVKAHLAVSRLKRRFYRDRWNSRVREVSAEISMLPPCTVLKEGGSAYQEVGGAWGLRAARFRPPPAHAAPEHLAWYVTRPAVLAPKADGVFYEGPLPADAWPACTFADVIVQAEVVEVQGREVYLVFDWMSDDVGHTTLSERMSVLRDSHAWASKSEDDSGLAEFVAGSGAATIWWPKRAALVCGPQTLRLIADPPAEPYPTDGWILAPEAPQESLRREDGRYPPTVKVKPAHEMTADALWRPGQGWLPLNFDAPPPPRPAEDAMWRCHWTGAGWAAREPRPEKERPNPPVLIQSLERWHAAPWNPADLIPYLERRHYQGLVCNLSAQTEAFLRAQRRAIRKWLRGAGVADCARVLDLGCGRGAQRLPGPEWVGVDVDPASIAEARLANPGGDWLWADAAAMAHPLTGAAAVAGTFDAFVAVHSLQASARPGAWEGWRDSITRHAAPGARLCIVMVDAARLFGRAALERGGEPLRLPDGSWARPLGSGELPGSYLIRTSLAWAASGAAPVTETFTTAADVIAHFGSAGWRLESLEAALEMEPGRDGWDLWRQAECRIVLIAA